MQDVAGPQGRRAARYEIEACQIDAVAQHQTADGGAGQGGAVDLQLTAGTAEGDAAARDAAGLQFDRAAGDRDRPRGAARGHDLIASGKDRDVARHRAGNVERATARHRDVVRRSSRRNVQHAATADGRVIERASRRHVHRAARNSGSGTGHAGDHPSGEYVFDAAGKHRDIAQNRAADVEDAAARDGDMVYRRTGRDIQVTAIEDGRIFERRARENVDQPGNYGARTGDAGDGTTCRDDFVAAT